MKKVLTIPLMILLALSLSQCSKQEGADTPIIPEMKEFMAAFGSKANVEKVVKKYEEEGVVPIQLTRCLLEKPEIAKKVTRDGIHYYTVEAKVTDCDCMAKVEGSVRVFTLGWKDGKIVSFTWEGIKDGNEAKHFG